MTILIVEDDLALASTLSQVVEGQGYLVDVVHNGIDAVYYATNTAYDAMVLDVMLPKLNGYDVIKMLRTQGVHTPTLMLTAKHEIADKITGLDAGADDYMTKPFSPDELLARLRALLRRQGDVVSDNLDFNGLTLDKSAYALKYGTKRVNLSKKEYDLFYLLISAPGTVVSKDTLINKVWGALSDAEDNNVEAYVSFIRKKLNYLQAADAVTIRTIRGAGYMLEAVQ